MLKYVVSWNSYGYQASAFATLEEAKACWEQLEAQGLQPTIH
jgi:hypothetical protein